jgi:hypothetical protein
MMVRGMLAKRVLDGVAEEEEAEEEEGRMEEVSVDDEAEDEVPLNTLDVEDGATEVDELVADADADMLDEVTLALALTEGSAVELELDTWVDEVDALALEMLEGGAEASVRDSE